MAAITTQLGLVTPTQGDLSGTWGNTVNNGITEYTNIAIAGTLTLTGDGAVTLANTTGDASASNITSTLAGAGTVTAQFAIVKVSGTTTTKVVTGPSYSKTYVVDNSSSYAVTFKASGQTGVSIAAGEKVTVFFNSAVSNADYIKLAGTIANAAGSNTQVQYNSSGVLAGSANMTFDGTSMTLGGNPTLSAGTANGVTYLNGSKVLTSGSALTFDGTNLAATAVATTFTMGTTTSTGTVSGAGTNAGSIVLSGATRATYPSNIQYAGTTQIWYNESYATEYMRLTSTGLGIGTSSPLAPLHVYRAGASSVRIDTDASTNSTQLNFAIAGTNKWSLYRPSSSNDLRLFDNATAIDVMTWQVGGNVGIGTSSPAYKLDVQGATGTTTSGIYETSASGSSIAISRLRTTGTGRGYWDIRTGNTASGLTGALDFFDNIAGASRLNLDNAGNLGLGVTPSAWDNRTAIQNGSASFASSSANRSVAEISANSYLSTGGIFRYLYSSANATLYQQATGTHVWYTAASGTAGNAITFTQAMTLDASGRLLLGTTTQAGMLTVSAPASNTYGTFDSVTSGFGYHAYKTGGTTIAYIGQGNGLFSGGTISEFGITTATANSLVLGTNSTERARIDSSGRLLVGLTSNLSGARLQVQGATDTAFTALTVNASTNDGYMGIGYSSSGSVWQIFPTYNATAGYKPLAFVLSGSEQARFPTAGGFQSVNSISVGNATPTTSGAGITFPATQSASTDANTLDDYEEGTWTPAITDDIGAAVMTSGASGFYTKVGRLVTVTFNEISWSSKGTLATAPLYVSGLPFTSRSTNRSVGQFGPASASSFTNANRLVPTLEANATKVSLSSINATSNQGTDYSVSSLGTSGVLYAFSLTYFV